ncbi:hypothetical protein GOODEAATRI_029960, partial [Goodea atripinnis]
SCSSNMVDILQNVMDHAVAVARKAGEMCGVLGHVLIRYVESCTNQVVRDAVRDDRKVMTKSSAVDLVTQTDQKVEQLIIQSVKEKFPEHRYEALPPNMCGLSICWRVGMIGSCS